MMQLIKFLPKEKKEEEKIIYLDLKRKGKDYYERYKKQMGFLKKL